ncbi:MAG: DUF116 domain-containing protein [Candidatus Coatesbacteria bacterium]|nr:DUF116 domain-containing protein [Candidatus Coatesbacteria bacterium]
MGANLETNSSGESTGGTQLCVRMLSVTAVLIAAVLIGGIAVFGPFLAGIYDLLPIAFYVAVFVGLAVILFGIWKLATTRSSSSSILSRTLRKSIIRFLLPVAALIGRLFGISRDSLISSFIEINNMLTMEDGHAVAPSEMLVLLPQCIQASGCAHRLTNDIHNCKRCGRCDVARLLDIFDKYGLDAHVVPGGTLARDLIKTKRPKLVLAVACERELSSGIADIYPTPVISVINERPNGPCVETKAQCESIDKILTHLLGTCSCANGTGLVDDIHKCKGDCQLQNEDGRSAD